MPDLSTRTGWRDPPAPRRSSWTRAWPWAGALGLDRMVVVYCLWLAVAAAYWPSSKAFDQIWTNSVDPYTHGYLILASSLWLIFRSRGKLAASVVIPAPGAWALVVALSACWVWAWRASIQDVELLLIPAILLAAIASALGWRLARRVLFPVCFLYFAMPAWSDLHAPLQFLSAKAVGVLMWLTALPGYMQGDVIQLPAGALRIAEGCAGLHYVIVGLALGSLYGELCQDSRRRRLLWLAIMGAVALLANWVRIFVVAVAAYESDMRSSLVHHHYWFGWGLFAVSFVGFLWLAERLTRRWGESQAPQPAADETGSSSAGGGVRAARAGIALVCLAALPALSYSMDMAHRSSPAVIAMHWPIAPPGWKGPEAVEASEWAPVFTHASVASMQRYVDTDGQSIQVFSAAYKVQRQDPKLLGYWNSLLGNRSLLRLLSGRTVKTPAGQWRESMVADPGGTRSLIWSQYRIGDRTFVDPRLSQLWYGIAALTSQPLSSVTALRAVCRPVCQSAHARLEAAVVGLAPALRLEAPTGGGSAR